MGLLDGNSGSGNGLNGVQLYNDTVAISSALPWSGTLLPVLYGGCSSLTVPPRVTLTLGAGTIVKGQPNGCAYLGVQGTLRATGTAADPVTLTSWRDDTVGGDTNGDGSSTAPVAGDWGGLWSSPAGNGNPSPAVNLAHVDVRYASSAISTSGTATTIADSTVSHTQYDGIHVDSPIGVPTVKDNGVISTGGVAISVSSGGIDMGALNGNSGSGNGLNGVQLYNDTVAVSSALPWTGTLLPVLYGGCSSLTVPSGVTLTLGAGTIVKGQPNGCTYIGVQGTVRATGTAGNPVVLTSWRDDTVGGDTNGDGNLTAPVAGDWGGLYSSPAGNGNPNPTLDLAHVDVRYASSAISTSGTATTIADSTVSHTQYDGIHVDSPIGVPTVARNTVTNAGGVAIEVGSAGIDMGALNGNSGSGNGLNSVQLYNDTVTVSSALPWSGTLLPVLYGGCSSLTVPPRVTLTLGAGTIVKGQPNGCTYIGVQGTLLSTGTAANPVTLTSWRDDSVGGDTNADGGRSGPLAGDWGGIYSSPARTATRTRRSTSRT